MTSRPTLEGRAVVIGAGVAGLCAARVLSDHVADVVVLDRDALPDHAAARDLVPQGRHPHLLLVTGARLLERWFPGILAELESGGAVGVDILADFYWYQSGGVMRRPPSDLHSPSMSRPFLELAIRRRVAALPNVTVLDGVAATGLDLDEAGAGVAAVRTDHGAVLPCRLVVDASGRQARTLAWLEALGFEPPPVSLVHVDTRYVSQAYERGEAPARDWEAAAVIDSPASRRQAMALPVEGDRWIVALAGVNGEAPPTGEDARLEWARALPSPVIADLIAVSRPVGEPVTHRFPANQRRHVERLRRFARGWVLLGDSMCSFDPIYGQGMTVAMLQAEALGACLDRARSLDRRFSRRYFRAASRAVAVPWSITVGGDFAYAGTTGKRPPGTDLLNRYVDRIVLAAQIDDRVARRFQEVAALVRRPGSLFGPAIVASVLRHGRTP